jgi:hypothetical protein
MLYEKEKNAALMEKYKSLYDSEIASLKSQGVVAITTY